MAEQCNGQFKMMIMQCGTVPPSGGPLRQRYLDQQGRLALDNAASEYQAALALLGDRVPAMPDLDFPLIEIEERLRVAIQRDKRAQWLKFWAATDEEALDSLRPHIEMSVRSAVDALNYLEDHELREEAHAAIHQAAFVKRGLFGCPIVLRDDVFWTDCAINMSHLRMGVSAGLVSDCECSVCGEPVEDCDHQMGVLYPTVAKRTPEGRCNLCDSMECEHPEGESLPVRAYAVATNITAGEISLVPRPRYPLARIIEQVKDMGALQDDPLVIEAASNGDLNCDADLGPCKGFNEMTDWDFRD